MKDSVIVSHNLKQLVKFYTTDDFDDVLILYYGQESSTFDILCNLWIYFTAESKNVLLNSLLYL
jgi:chemotaxis methyl-accepting protein methylase